MKNCLFSQGEADILSEWRKGTDIEPLIISCLKNKKKELGGRFDFDQSVHQETIENRSMIQIGG